MVRSMNTNCDEMPAHPLSEFWSVRSLSVIFGRSRVQERQLGNNNPASTDPCKTPRISRTPKSPIDSNLVQQTSQYLPESIPLEMHSVLGTMSGEAR